MKRTYIFLLLGAAIAATAQAQELQRTDLAVTVYNQDRAVIYDARRLQLKEGTSQVSFSDVAECIDPTSVQLTSKGAPFEVMEQNFDYDLAGNAQLLYRYLGRNVTLNLKDGMTATGALLAGPQGWSSSVPHIALSAEAGSIRMLPLHRVKDFSLEPVGGKVQSKPTLNWLVRSREAGERDCKIAYMTSGMSWKADYTLLLPSDAADRTMANLSGVVTITNNTGASFPDARLKLVAGKLNLVEDPRRFPRMLRAVSGEETKSLSEPAFQERQMFEYHLYDLQRRTTLLDCETKQIDFLKADKVPLDRFFVYDGALVPDDYSRMGQREYGAECDKSVWTYLEVKNSEENHLGMPLPMGRIMLMERTKDGDAFIGALAINHTPRNEDILLRVGRAFDLTGERVQTDFNENGNVMSETFEIALRSARNAPANLRVVEHMYRGADWKMLQASDEYEKTNSDTVEFRFRLEPGKEKKISYTVQYTF